MIVPPSLIRQIFPRASTEVAAALASYMPVARIDSIARIAAFLAQVGHESGGLTRLSENLNYSFEGLRATWPSRFVGESGATLARSIARQPEKIANTVYANRMGNGDTASGDGWRYRGRGLIQLTGRANYRLHRLEDSPDTAAEPDTAARIAVTYWRDNGLNELADANRFADITRRINGGLLGQTERVALRDRIIEVLRNAA